MFGKSQFFPGRVFSSLLMVSSPLFVCAFASAAPWATSVVSYDAGVDAQVGYTANPNVALGLPDRLSGEILGFPASVTMFSAPFDTDEIVSIGVGGQLTLEFDQPIVDDPANPFGVDMIVYGNTFFATSDFVVGDIAGSNAEPSTIEVSANGTDWVTLSTQADTLFPTQAYLDAGIFGTDDNFVPNGSIPTDFFKPMNPALTINDFLGLTYAEALTLYDGSAGGTPVDLAGSGLNSVSFVRISVDSNAPAGFSAEIDAIVNVPEPTTVMLFASICIVALPRRRSTE